MLTTLYTDRKLTKGDVIPIYFWKTYTQEPIMQLCRVVHQDANGARGKCRLYTLRVLAQP